MRSVCTLGLLLVVSTAHADEPAPVTPTKASSADAKKLADQATQLFGAKQYDKAAELYQQAYVLDPSPGYLYATAQAQRLGGTCEQALITYDAYLRTNPADGERAKTEANIERCKQDLAARAAAVQPVTAPEPTPPLPPPPAPARMAPMPAQPAPSEQSYLIGHVLVGSGVVAFAGGLYLFQDGRRTISKHNAAATYQDFVDGRDGVDGAQQKQTLGVVAMTAGVALAAGGVVYYVLHARNAEQPAVTATVSTHEAALWFRRSF